MRTDNACTLCGQIAGERARNAVLPLVRTIWGVRPVLAEMPRAVVMPSIGALAPGHVLICPTAHLRSIAAADDLVQRSVGALAADTEARLVSATRLPVHRFEHGSSRDGARVACSVEHAHLHLLPARVDIRAELPAVATWRRIGASSEELRDAVDGAEYLMYNAPTGERWVATTIEGFPSQVMRRVLAARMGVAHWDWRAEPAIKNVVATAALFAVGSSSASAPVAATC